MADRGTSSGMIPNFAVLSSALWVPSSNRTKNVSQMFSRWMVQSPKATSTISAIFSQTVSRRLLKRSAAQPDQAANTTNGKTMHPSPMERMTDSSCTAASGVSAGSFCSCCFASGMISHRNMLSFSAVKKHITR